MTDLQNKQILLTRPKQQSGELQRELEKRKAVVHLAPLIRTELIDSEATALVFSRLNDLDWLVFTSTNGVEYFKQHLRKAGVQAPPHSKIAVIGPATAATVERSGWKITLIPESAHSESLTRAFEKFDLIGKRIGLFLAEKTRDLLGGAMAQMGAKVIQVPVYRTVSDPEGIVVLKNLQWDKIDAIVFMSASAAEVFAFNRPAAAFGSHAKYCAVGPATEQRMRELGLPVHLLAQEASSQGIIQILEKAL